MIKFNMNNYVWFEPTELGLQVYVDYYKAYGFDHRLELVDGKARLQFHNFIDVFGEYITTFVKIAKCLNIMSFILMRRNWYERPKDFNHTNIALGGCKFRCFDGWR